MTPELLITAHSYVRAKERLGWKPGALDRMAVKAYAIGFTISDTSGELKKYLEYLLIRYPHANNTRIHGEVIYFFKDERLITLYRLRNDLIKYLKHLKR